MFGKMYISSEKLLFYLSACTSIRLRVRAWACSSSSRCSCFLFTTNIAYCCFTLSCFCSFSATENFNTATRKIQPTADFYFLPVKCGQGQPPGKLWLHPAVHHQVKMLSLCIWDTAYLTKQCVWALFNHPGCLQTTEYFCARGMGIVYL